MKLIKLLLSCCLIGLSYTVFAQDDEAYYEQRLRQEVTVENPSYMPVIGLGIGTMNFFGNVNSNLRSSVNGKPAYKLNVTTFLDKKHIFKMNIAVLLGNVTANQYSLTDSIQNRNFSSDISSFGLNFQYDFKNIIKESFRIRPYISIGVEDVQFNSKTDLYDGQGRRYHYWSDGSIRDIDQATAGGKLGNLLQRDYSYETDLRKDQGYSQSAFAIPIDIGLDFKVSERVNFHVGQSWHFTFSKNFDNQNFQTSAPGYTPNKKNGIFSMSYVSLHLDLFSDAKTKIIQKLFEGIDFDNYEMLDDEDNDGVFDNKDECPGTPFGVPVDSVGCPFDKDKDGIPDFRDKEANTPPGAMVDDDGVQIKSDELAGKLNAEAINRKEVVAFLMLHKAQNRYSGKPTMPLPALYKSLDLDADSYISFDELLKAIDDFFDSSSKLSSKEIYELQDFFFEQ